MAKTAMIGVRVDEQLKDDAQKVFDDIGIPLSLAVEMFLNQVVETGALPFSIGKETSDKQIGAKREKEQRELWKAFILWYFQVWPTFNTAEAREIAQHEYGFNDRGAGEIAQAYLDGDCNFKTMSPEQYAATMDVCTLRSLLHDAKELIYWALGMDYVFVPELSSRYGSESDKWRLYYLKEKKKSFENVSRNTDDNESGEDYFGDGDL